MHKCTFVQYSQILDKKPIVGFFFDQKSFLRFTWHILQYNLLFSSYFEQSIQRQLKTAEQLIFYPL